MNLYRIRLPKASTELAGASATLDEPEAAAGREGFLYSEFEENPRIFLIPADIKAFSPADALHWIARNDEAAAADGYPFPSRSTTKDEHLAQINRLKRRMEDWEKSGITPTKIIAARIRLTATDKTAWEIFDALSAEYPSACVFLFSTSRHGTWIGATPEALLFRHGDLLSTMSLAGTRWHSGHTSAQGWDEKNLEEQRIVTRFILDVLESENLTPSADGPYTLKAGEIEHLATDIRAAVGCHSHPMDIICRLAPTPALSGFPRDESIRVINSTENRLLFTPRIKPATRQCYGGVVGYTDGHGDFLTFANLRSGRYDSARRMMALYAGGGITLKSQPEKEWEETEHKLTTMQKIM